MGTVEFGIVQVGQLWCVIGPDRRHVAFANREQAIAAAKAIASEYQKKGAACDVLVQDEVGQLVSVGALE